MKELKLVCTGCMKKFSIKEALYRCDDCNEPLEVETISKGMIREKNILKQNIIERYSDFFPFLEIDKEISLGEGFTAIVRTNKLAQRLGVNKIFFKNESQNPTWSFKDRGTLLGIQHALKLGYKKIGTVSTGNMAVSVAAYGKKAKLETFIFVKNTLPNEKLGPIAIYNPHLIKVQGDYGQLYYKSLEIGRENDIYFINSDAPLRVEGSKSIAFEICEQLNFEIPDYIIVPTSAGGNIRGIEKGFREFYLTGLINRVPKIICAQASGCSPIFNAYIDKNDKISRIDNPDTIAHAIENPFPPSGNQVLRIIEKNGGICVSVDDREIIEAQRMLAEEGIFGQPASAVPLATINKLKKQQRFNGNETIVCIVTGSGLKYSAALEKHNLKSYDCKLDDMSGFIKESF